jgi:hypothetical protein
MQTMRMLITLPALLIATHAAAQTPPSIDKLPPARTVTDRARPDYMYPQPWAGSAVTVIAVFGVECGPCQASVPFYKRLSAHPAIDRRAASFAVLAKGGIWPVIDAIQAHPQGFRAKPVASYPDDDRFAVRDLPTLLVIDGAWKERGRWTGVLSAAQEAEVFALVSQLSKGVAK